MKRHLLIPVLAAMVAVVVMLLVVPSANADRSDHGRAIAHRGHRSYLYHYHFGHSWSHHPYHHRHPRVYVPFPGHQPVVYPPVYHYRRWYYRYPHSGIYYYGPHWGFSFHF